MQDPPSASPSQPEGKRPEGEKADALNTRQAPIDILLVEDNEPDVYVIRELILKLVGSINLQIVRDGAAALDYLKDETNVCPHLVLLDLNLPKIGGIEVLQRLRNSGRCGQAPVIVVSSSDSEAERSAARGLGAAAYFRKPADLSAYSGLADLISGILSGESSKD